MPKTVPIIEEEEEAELSPGGGGIGAHISRFGYLLPKLLGTAITKHQISSVDAFRLTNLKPPTMLALFENAEKRLN